MLIDVHSQHETLTLNDSAFQLNLVDVYAYHRNLLMGYKTEFAEYKEKQKVLAELTQRDAQSKKDYDYFKFQFEELKEANLIEGEQVVMEKELETLNNAEEIKGNVSKSHYALGGGEQNIISSLNSVRSIVANAGKYNNEINALSERLNSSIIEIKDISNELEDLEQKIVYDPKRIEELIL